MTSSLFQTRCERSLNLICCLNCCVQNTAPNGPVTWALHYAHYALLRLMVCFDIICMGPAWGRRISVHWILQLTASTHGACMGQMGLIHGASWACMRPAWGLHGPSDLHSVFLLYKMTHNSQSHLSHLLLMLDDLFCRMMGVTLWSPWA